MVVASRRFALRFLFTVVVIAITAVVDLLVLEVWLAPSSTEHSLDWAVFEQQADVPLAGQVTILRWTPILWVLSGLLLLQLGLTHRRIDMPLAGLLLFITGGAHVLAYWFQGMAPAAEVPRLDAHPLLGMTRSDGGHVTGVGLYIVAGIGLALAVATLVVGEWLGSRRRKAASGKIDPGNDDIIQEALNRRGATATWRRGDTARDVGDRKRKSAIRSSKTSKTDATADAK